MTQYYYFVASLPSLAFQQPVPVTRDWFMTEAKTHLHAEDYQELQALLDGRAADVATAFGKAWFNRICQLRNAIARARAARLGVDDKKFLKEHTGLRLDIEAAVNEAFARTNPLDRELALDRLRWSLAEELAAGGLFGLATVLSYALKLSIGERWKALTQEKGLERLEEIIGLVGVSAQEVSGWSGLAQM